MQFLSPAGALMGVTGFLICAIAGIIRLIGTNIVLPLQVEEITLFIVGIALMTAGCLARLYSLDGH